MNGDDIYNVGLKNPTIVLDRWANEAPRWTSLAQEVGVVREFKPLTVKVLYITGLILASCRSISILLDKNNLVSTTFYPAYGIFASSIDLLGRCIRGDDNIRSVTDDIRAGFRWLAQPSISSYETVSLEETIVKTKIFSYSINDLIALRHFAAHGQATTATEIKDFDYLLLAEMPPLLATGVQSYLTELMSSEMLASNLARASVAPYRNRPIFDALWGFNADAVSFPKAVAEAIRKSDWSYKLCLS